METGSGLLFLLHPLFSPSSTVYPPLDPSWLAQFPLTPRGLRPSLPPLWSPTLTGASPCRRGSTHGGSFPHSHVRSNPPRVSGGWWGGVRVVGGLGRCPASVMRAVSGKRGRGRGSRKPRALPPSPPGAPRPTHRAGFGVGPYETTPALLLAYWDVGPCPQPPPRPTPASFSEPCRGLRDRLRARGETPVRNNGGEIRTEGRRRGEGGATGPVVADGGRRALRGWILDCSGLGSLRPRSVVGRSAPDGVGYPR